MGLQETGKGRSDAGNTDLAGGIRKRIMACASSSGEKQ
ncbi:uncharacterized protein G2W53_029354 [Senna tora]|uniref:Uncharacterized protein n=1 Tax=Senna tora TaxID=362788 RepID=A0A834T5G7_9FABA|nr:uncharacterized protein G2W53_029354 [Senna tora]